jgi:hypothetical protein
MNANYFLLLSFAFILLFPCIAFSASYGTMFDVITLNGGRFTNNPDDNAWQNGIPLIENENTINYFNPDNNEWGTDYYKYNASLGQLGGHASASGNVTGCTGRQYVRYYWCTW